ncbi:hypothetical protein [Streptomyces sp. NPDC050145]|uniref:helix-turn-helix domain-containing protein n=1 Tax=Streptomyces sp. NPDC050145 TaxID=3365602 RepID=UPI003796EDFD
MPESACAVTSGSRARPAGAAGPVGAEALRTTRAWSQEEWDASVDGLRSRGWLCDDDTPTFTPEGARRRADIEAVTDRLAAAPYLELGAEACSELCALARPWSRALAAELMPWALPRIDKAA